MLSPYFNLLAEQIPSRPELVADFFLASETLVRPGVANTQAVLARELSGGTDDAARLFRQSVTLTREIERSRVELARLRTIEQPKPEELARIANLQKSIEALALDQTATQAKLGDFPKYRALSTQALTLADLQKSLRPEEAYLKLATVGNDVFAIYVGPDSATAYRAAVSVSGLDLPLRREAGAPPVRRPAGTDRPASRDVEASRIRAGWRDAQAADQSAGDRSGRRRCLCRAGRQIEQRRV
jgi:hypothetical protein